MIEDQWQGIRLLYHPKAVEAMPERGGGISCAKTEIKLAQQAAQTALLPLNIKVLEGNGGVLLSFILGI
jgi:hypothetical protein